MPWIIDLTTVLRIGANDILKKSQVLAERIESLIVLKEVIED